MLVTMGALQYLLPPPSSQLSPSSSFHNVGLGSIHLYMPRSVLYDFGFTTNIISISTEINILKIIGKIDLILNIKEQEIARIIQEIDVITAKELVAARELRKGLQIFKLIFSSKKILLTVGDHARRVVHMTTRDHFKEQPYILLF
jgi:hypothetical protein